MTINRITIYTAIHVIVTVAMWAALFGAALGLGFKDELTTGDHIFKFVAYWGTMIMAFPLCWLVTFEIPVWANYLLLPLQLLSSFIQVNIVLLVWAVLKTRNKASNPTP